MIPPFLIKFKVQNYSHVGVITVFILYVYVACIALHL